VETGIWIAGSKAVKNLKLTIHLHRIHRAYLHIIICLHAVVVVTGINLHLYIFWYMICMFILNYCIYIRGKDIIAGHSNYGSILQMLGFMPLLFGIIKLCFLKI
jgi:hypothetical protein